MDHTPLLVALGDSLTAGHISSRGFVTYHPYTTVLQDALDPPPRIQNHGLDGDLTRGILARLRGEVLAQRPNLVVACGGANDLGWSLGIEEPLQNMTRVVEESRHGGALVVLGAVPPIADIFGYPQNRPTQLRLELNRGLAELGGRQGVFFVDLFGPLAEQSGTLKLALSSDGLHLNKQGYTLMGKLFLPAVQAALDQINRKEKTPR
jgi:lysophospholipase L1-like esterase